MAIKRLLFLCLLLPPTLTRADQVPVRFPQGCSRGFLVLKTSDGRKIASGDLIQMSRGDRVTSRLVFHFRDGSIDDDTAVFSQLKDFRLIRDRHIQSGPSFPKPLDMTVDVASGTVTSRSSKNDGKTKIVTEHLDLPSDLANGFVSTLVENIPASRPEATFSYVASTGASTRVIHLKVRPNAAAFVTINGHAYKATDYALKIEVGGLAGVIAPILGKQPQDVHIWILSGPVPTVVAEESPLYLNGPVWRMELTSPTWPRMQR